MLRDSDCSSLGSEWELMKMEIYLVSFNNLFVLQAAIDLGFITKDSFAFSRILYN